MQSSAPLKGTLNSNLQNGSAMKSNNVNSSATGQQAKNGENKSPRRQTMQNVLNQGSSFKGSNNLIKLNVAGSTSNNGSEDGNGGNNENENKEDDSPK